MLREKYFLLFFRENILGILNESRNVVLFPLKKNTKEYQNVVLLHLRLAL